LIIAGLKKSAGRADNQKRIIEGPIIGGQVMKRQKLRKMTAFALAFIGWSVIGGALAQSARPADRVQKPGQFISTQELVGTCMPRTGPWADFCNGLIQGYKEYLQQTNIACIPAALSRRELVEILIAPEIVVFSGWIDDWPAIVTAKIIFAERFPCE
jgi:hypothetical protein